ncbi:MAG: photosynthetic complex putative assembly protein PuhB [Pseudomonadota bacterium]
MREHDDEPVMGLPEELPAGETILWQGKPRWRGLARRAFHARTIAIYLGALLVWHSGSGLYWGNSLLTVAQGMMWPVIVAVACVALVVGLAWVTTHYTLYTITNRRLVIRFGVAIPMSINLPFKVIGTASFVEFADGTGDLPVHLLGKDRIAYLHLWPNARPWRFKDPEPMLRSIPDIENVRKILANALRAETLRLQREHRQPMAAKDRATEEQAATPAGTRASGVAVAAE